jgi:hypothetical protein
MQRHQGLRGAPVSVFNPCVLHRSPEAVHSCRQLSSTTRAVHSCRQLSFQLSHPGAATAASPCPLPQRTSLRPASPDWAAATRAAAASVASPPPFPLVTHAAQARKGTGLLFNTFAYASCVGTGLLIHTLTSYVGVARAVAYATDMNVHYACIPATCSISTHTAT